MNRIATHTTIALFACLLCPTAWAGRKDKKQPDVASEAPTAQVPNTPADGPSVKFGGQLMKIELTNFRPGDGGGAKFVYSSLKFAPDNTWQAEAYVEIDDEKMECIEKGGWTMEPAESEKIAVVAWKVETTDCAGRDAGSELRARLTLAKDGSVKTEWR